MTGNAHNVGATNLLQRILGISVAFIGSLVGSSVVGQDACSVLGGHSGACQPLLTVPHQRVTLTLGEKVINGENFGVIILEHVLHCVALSINLHAVNILGLGALH